MVVKRGELYKVIVELYCHTWYKALKRAHFMHERASHSLRNICTRILQNLPQYLWLTVHDTDVPTFGADGLPTGSP